MSQVQPGAASPAVHNSNFDRKKQSSVIPALPLTPPYIRHHPPPPPQVFAQPFYPSNVQPYIPPPQQYPIVQTTPQPPPPPAVEPTPVPEPAPEPVQSQFKPPIPWYSAPGPFPPRQRRKIRIVPALPRRAPESDATPKATPVPSEINTPRTSQPPSEADTTLPTTPSSTRPPSIIASVAQKPTPALPLTSPVVPHVVPKKTEVKKVAKAEEAPKVESTSNGVVDVKSENDAPVDQKAESEKAVEPAVEGEKAPEPEVEKPAEAPAAPAAPKAWADLLRKNEAKPATAAAVAPKTVARTNGAYASLEEALKDFRINSAVSAPFLEPRGLVNTGNMCFMNGILQMLVYCGPFYYFLEKISTAAKNFKDDTPLIETMIMFMREFRVITKDGRSRIRSDDLEAMGEPFAPENVYETIRKLKRFSHMRRGHQHDAEEFLGFLLDGLHEEAVEMMQKTPAPVTNGGTEETGWMEVGHKQKVATTRTTEIIESPITKIFGGKLRSEFKVPGLAPSVTLEPYTPLQLDIQSPEVKSVIDALRHITKPEKIQGDFKSPKGPNVTATKQVFIDSVPPVLILHLKRFQYDNTGGAQKIWKQIAYPLELDFPAEAMSPARRSGLKPKYRLIGVVYHHGTSASGGHYTVDVLRQDTKSWMRMDDTVIRRVSAQDVVVDLKDVARNNEDDHASGWEEVNGNGEVSGTPKPQKYFGKDNKVAYILFYQRI